MRFFFISECGDGLGLAVRMQLEGHDVQAWVRDDEASKRCRGILELRTPERLDRDTIVISDCTGSGVFCDGLRLAGLQVIGGSVLADRLEQDRHYAEEVMQACEIATPKTKYFTEWPAATKFVEATEERLVFKPEGELSGVVPSYVATDQEEMIEVLKNAEAKHPKIAPEFALQEFIEGTCVSTECWFNGSNFVRPFNHTIERKQFLNGDLGPSGGCSGNIVWACDEDGCEICKATVSKLEDFLRESMYSGPIDVNAVVSEVGVFGLEFTPRFGYDATPTLLCALLDERIGDFFYEVLNTDGYEQPLLEGFAAGIRVTLPPWPSEKYDAAEGVPLRGLKNLEHFYPYDLMRAVDGELCSSGAFGIVGVALGHGETIEDAFVEAQRYADKLRLPDKQYRTDLDAICTKDFRRLQRLNKVLSEA